MKNILLVLTMLIAFSAPALAAPACPPSQYDHGIGIYASDSGFHFAKVEWIDKAGGVHRLAKGMLLPYHGYAEVRYWFNGHYMERQFADYRVEYYSVAPDKSLALICSKPHL